ncbi:LPD7 domain-containing protein [Buttiauxella agrestis]
MMGSKDIRNMMNNNRKNLSGFTISAPEPEKEQPSQTRFARVLDKLRNPVNYSKVADDSRKAVEKHLDASNLYTKRTRKGHVHYLDKSSDKTLFVDNGQLITMRKNGLSKDSVAVALELAQGRFGSTLNIKGSKQFKEMVVNVVAEKGLDIHFTDKKMNEALQLRRQELEKAKEQRDSSGRDSAFTIGGAEPEVNKAAVEHDDLNDEPAAANVASDTEHSPLYRSVSKLEGKIVKHGEAPYLDKEGNSASYYVTLKGKDGQETTQWGVGLKDALKGFRRGHEVSLELKESKPVQVRVRDENGKYSTREAVRNVWEATRLDGPQPKKVAEPSKSDVSKGFRMVNHDDPSPDLA